MPTLYIVATPIGNLEDISLRAIRVLRQVGLIAAEDTRKTRRLLAAHQIKTTLTSYHEHSQPSKLSYILDCLRKGDVALVSEAGMPGISDPGYELIVAAIERGIPIVPIPGPSIVVTAVTVSGLPANQFTYLGFLPRKRAERKRFLESIADEPRTMVALESPHRLLATLGDLLEVLGDRRIAVCRELTKVHEEVFRGTVREAIEHFSEPRGEFTLVIESKGKGREAAPRGDVEEELRQLYAQGISIKEAVARVARLTNTPKKVVYRAWLQLS